MMEPKAVAFKYRPMSLMSANSGRKSARWFLDPGDSCTGCPVPRRSDVGNYEAGDGQIKSELRFGPISCRIFT